MPEDVPSGGAETGGNMNYGGLLNPCKRQSVDCTGNGPTRVVSLQ